MKNFEDFLSEIQSTDEDNREAIAMQRIELSDERLTVSS
ncbi:MAG: hypothetical protein ACJAW3_001261 [Lentimonas sp.]|jgi:hypothetical protein